MMNMSISGISKYFNKGKKMNRQLSVYDCSIIVLPKITNRAGNITALQSNIELPFTIQRAFYLYDVPGGESRGAHAHKQCHQFLVALSGSFEVLLDDGRTKRLV